MKSSLSSLRTHASLILTAALGFPFAASAITTVATDPVGIQRIVLKGDSRLNNLANPYIPAAKLETTIAAIAGTSLTLSSSATSSLAANNDYVEVLNGDGEGQVTNITAVNGAVLTLNDPLVITAGDRVAVRKIPTIDDVFGADNPFGFKGAAQAGAASADHIFVINNETQVTSRYYYRTSGGTVGWTDVDSGLAAGTSLLYPENGVSVYVRGPDVTMTISGQVKLTEAATAIYSGYNLLASFNPLPGTETLVSNGRAFTLSNSNLYTGNTSTGIAASADAKPAEADWIIITDPASQENIGYFYSTRADYTGWFNVRTFAPADDVTIEPGQAFYVLRRSNQPFSWQQPVNHMNP